MPEAARKSWNRRCSRRVLPVPETTEGANDMPYLSGVLTGILVTILAVYLIDHFGPQADTRIS
jgi:hypothetical protein